MMLLSLVSMATQATEVPMAFIIGVKNLKRTKEESQDWKVVDTESGVA